MTRITDAKTLGQHLRATREAKRWSLADVERISGGQWKAVAVASYERGDRAISAIKLVALLALYGHELVAAPVGQLSVGDDATRLEAFAAIASVVDAARFGGTA